ncbi:hypothetical protein FQ154_09815 [Paeniglutamicibacter gangotriensis]|uniref:Uncharacterized protein n=1 Tax=Paeniglutamicibacter gangotriensis TaxID=254787 RepID=A0A5B0EFM8_9MICC|nr:hypothetical protein [Paeniglutamicibacter gangotriensis]KAA0977182.1 hypothetical protein FQ154_09815 [Paeniglutamicibacter gangotriensis]
MDDDKTPEAVQEADTAYDALRALAHLTRATHPAPEVYRILGNLKNFGSFIPQISEQLAQGLVKSLEEYDVTEYEGKDPAASVAVTGEHLARAAKLAQQMGEELAQAQNAIAGQGYRTAEERRREEELRRENSGG